MLDCEGARFKIQNQSSEAQGIGGSKMGTHAVVTSNKQVDGSPRCCFSGPVDSQDPRRSSFQLADREENQLRCDPLHAEKDPRADAFLDIVGSGQAMQCVLDQVRAAARPTQRPMRTRGPLRGPGRWLRAS